MVTEPEAAGPDRPGGGPTWARRRAVPLALIVATVATATAYSLAWGPLVQHHSGWIQPGDLWGTFRTAQFVTWGDIGDVYSSGAGLVSLPGISVALAPVAFVVDHLGLSISFPHALPHPTAWLVLGPYQAALGAIVLIPLDALAEELGLGYTSRTAASVSGAVVLWPVLAIWGHPEDALAMAFAVWGLLAAFRDRWTGAGWCWGCALVLQPLVVLMLPIVFAMAPVRRWVKLALRCAVPTALLVAIPLEQAWQQTTTALFKQPNYPVIDHATPWLALAPVLHRSTSTTVANLGEQSLGGTSFRFTTSIAHAISGEVVAAGPGRLFAIGLALLIGFSVYRHRPTRLQAVWLCCVALSLRCVFEAVMNPYYLWPPLAIALVLVVRSRRRFGLAVVASAGLTVWSYRHTGPWEWWLPVVILLGLVVVLARPARPRDDRAVALPEPRRQDADSRGAVGALV